MSSRIAPVVRPSNNHPVGFPRMSHLMRGQRLSLDGYVTISFGKPLIPERGRGVKSCRSGITRVEYLLLLSDLVRVWDMLHSRVDPNVHLHTRSPCTTFEGCLKMSSASQQFVPRRIVGVQIRMPIQRIQSAFCKMRRKS